MPQMCSLGPWFHFSHLWFPSTYNGRDTGVHFRKFLWCINDKVYRTLSPGWRILVWAELSKWTKKLTMKSGVGITTPHHVHRWIPGTWEYVTVRGGRDFEEGEDLEIWRWSWMMQVGPMYSQRASYEKDGGGSESETGHAVTEAEIKVTWLMAWRWRKEPEPKNANSFQKLEKVREQILR